MDRELDDGETKDEKDEGSSTPVEPTETEHEIENDEVSADTGEYAAQASEPELVENVESETTD